MKKRSIKLFNILFPMYLLWLVPVVWLVILPANFIVDSAVLLITLAVLKQPKMPVYRKAIFKIWGFGFLADFVGSAVLFIASRVGFAVYANESVAESVRGAFDDFRMAVDYDPFSNIPALMVTLLAIAFSAFCIYRFDLGVLAKTELSDTHKKRVALMLAIFTAPYALLIPARLFF